MEPSPANNLESAIGKTTEGTLENSIQTNAVASGEDRLRRPSLTHSVLAGAATAASGAVSAATHIVETARKLITNEQDQDVIEADGSLSISSLQKESSKDHHGLEFSQRRLSRDQNSSARKSSVTSISTTTGADRLPPTAPNTVYVSGHGSNSTRQQALGVDRPSISRTQDCKRSGLGVDVPPLVGQARPPGGNKTGALSVDKKHKDLLHDHEVHAPHYTVPKGEPGASIQTSTDNRRVLYGNQHHMDGNTSAAATAAIEKNPYEAHKSHGHRQSLSGMNVDHPVIPTAALAGSGSSDNTNRNRPAGTYNSGINVDKAGHHARKQSGMNVDGPAVSNYELSSMHDPHHGSVFGSSTSQENVPRLPEDDQQGVYGRVKDAFRRRSSVGSKVSLTQPDPGQTNAMASSISASAYSAPVLTDVPADYHGPIPVVGEGERIIWVKKITQTDYYDDVPDRTTSVTLGR